MHVLAGGTVLDLCSGSGVLGIFAADNACKVIGTDINPRAIEFAELNAELNEVTHKTEWRNGNLFDPVVGMRFDVILANPPFEPNLDGVSNYLYADGGKEGTDIVCKIIEKVPEYLNTCGSFQMICWLPGDSFSLLDQLRDFFGSERVLVKSLFDFSFYDYWNHRMTSAVDRIPMPFDNKESLHYVFIQVVPTIASIQEVYTVEKAIPFTGSVI
jgi:methylase of polypeptide subunit release factors